jgi:hypothetical protein
MNKGISLFITICFTDTTINYRLTPELLLEEELLLDDDPEELLLDELEPELGRE